MSSSRAFLKIFFYHPSCNIVSKFGSHNFIVTLKCNKKLLVNNDSYKLPHCLCCHSSLVSMDKSVEGNSKKL